MANFGGFFNISPKICSIGGILKYRHINKGSKLLSYKYKSFKKDKDDLNKYIAKKFKMEIDDVDGKEQQS